MKRLVMVLILTLAVISFMLVGCGGDEETAVTPTPAPAESTDSDDADSTPTTTAYTSQTQQLAIEIFQNIPAEWQKARYVDFAKFRDNADMRIFYETVSLDLADDLAAIGIALSEIDNIGFVGEHSALYCGNHDLDRIRQVLDEAGYSQSTYLDKEIWQSDNPDNGIVCPLSPGCVLVTKEYNDAELYISVIQDWGRSLYDDENIAAIVAKLPPEAIRIDIVRGGPSGPLATGKTVELTSDGALQMTTIAIFPDDSDAEDGLSAVTREFNTWARIWNMGDVETVRIRRFVKASAGAAITDVDNPLSHVLYWLH